MLKKMLAELVGTFFLLLAIAMTAFGGVGRTDLAPVAIGMTLAVMVYAGGHISGAHYNPAVTLAVVLRRKCRISEAPLYWGVQLIGAAMAVFLAATLKGDDEAFKADVAKHAAKVLGTADVLRYLLAEAVGTFALVWVVLNAATAKGTVGNSFYGFAIGGTVMVMAFVLGGISGGAFNPAVAFGVALLTGSFQTIWIYLVGNLLAAVAAAFLFNMTHEDAQG